MRYIFYTLLFCIGLSAFSFKQIETKINILKNRKDINFKDIDVPYDPFFKTKKILSLKKKRAPNTTPHKVRLVLLSVLNKRAFINNRWYKVGDRVYGFEVVKIYINRVVLKKNQKKMILNIRQKRKILNIVEK